jgi:hypothetical protein
LPGTKFSGEQTPFGISDGGGHYSSEEEEVCPVERTKASRLHEAERDCRDGTEAGHDPESQWRAFSTSDDSHQGRGCRQQRDHDGTMTGRRGGEREGSEKRKPDDHAAGHNGQPHPMHAVWKALPRQEQGEYGESGRDQSTP